MTAPESAFGHRPSLRDIAAKMGLSHVAVSLALRDSPRVSEEKRAKVRAMAQELGYRPDPMLASLAAYRRGKQRVGIRACLGWINQWEDAKALRRHREFDLYWQGAREAAESLGYHLEEFRWPVGKSCRRLQTILETRGVRGLLIPPHRTGPLLEDFDFDRFTLLRFGSSVESLPAHMVTSDQSHCSRLAYEKAVSLGYRRIGYVTDVSFERNTHGHFCEGFLNARQEFAPRKNQLSPLVFSRDARRHKGELKRWLGTQKPDAILSTQPALGGLLAELGLRVPGDIAVAATSVLDGNFDTGADQNSHEIGRVAVSVLAGLILENERGMPRFQRRTLVQGRWVQGQSMPSKVAGDDAPPLPPAPIKRRL